MGIGRLTIGRLMMVVVLASVNLAIGRWAIDDLERRLGVAIVTLPMVNVLALCMGRLRMSNPHRAYWLGFEAGGWLAVAAAVALTARDRPEVYAPLRAIADALGPLPTGVLPAIMVSIMVAFSGGTQLICAIGGGKLAARVLPERLAGSLSNRLLAVVAAMAAVDVAIVTLGLPLLDPLTLPMLNLLLLGLPRLRSGSPSRPFWLGFEAFGGLALLATVLMATCYSEAFFVPFRWLWRWSRNLLGYSLASAPGLIVYNLGQILPAILGGFLSTRFRVSVERRAPRPADLEILSTREQPA